MFSPEYTKLQDLLLERRKETAFTLDVSVLRERLTRATLPAADDIRTDVINMSGVSAERVVANAADKSRAILYVHGGGLVMGSPVTHRKLAGDVSRVTDAPTFVVDYRLGPEHTLPAPIDDLLTSYRYLLEHYEPGAIVLMGDSAGATLVILLMVRLRSEGLPLPGGAVLVTPWADYGCEDRSYIERAEVDPVTDVDQLRVYQDWFLGNQSSTDPAVFPLRADLRGLPPILIHAGGHDVTCSDAWRLARRASDSAVDVSFRYAPGMMHVWHVFAGRVPESTQAMAEVGSFARRCFSAASWNSQEASI
jgi:acetyl esterase/lipase